MTERDPIHTPATEPDRIRASRAARGRIRTPDAAPDRIQTPYLTVEDDLDRSLRPRRLEEFVGQHALRDQLAVAIEAARARGEALDHVLLAGPPGLGKTSLAQIVAAELDVPFVQTAGPALERKGDVAAFLTALEPRSVFFVDEIHRLPRALEETLYPAMEDRRLPITVGQGAGARVLTLDLPPFSLIGATTRAGLLTTPLRDRFGIQARLEAYPPEDLTAIVERAAGILGIRLEDSGAATIASRSRGTPRVANRLLKRVRDYAEVRMGGVVGARAAEEALEFLEVDARGLDRLDREILRVICQTLDGGPVGLSTLAIAVGEEQETIEDVYEPYLLREGLIKRTPRGREATPAAFAHLGLPLTPSGGHSSAAALF
jgi:Holliday junction DNA helicase RuvB